MSAATARPLRIGGRRLRHDQPCRKTRMPSRPALAWTAFAIGADSAGVDPGPVLVKGLKAITNRRLVDEVAAGHPARVRSAGESITLFTALSSRPLSRPSWPSRSASSSRYISSSTAAGPLARVTTFMVDILSGVPSIVAALFIFAVWISRFGFQQSAFAVSLALVLLMLPVVIRSTEEMLRLVPDELREASYALGVPKCRTILRVVLPTALSGIVSGILLAIARVMGETAPVLVLVGYSTSINYDVLKGNMASLPLLIYTQLINPTPAGQLRVWGGALTLIIIIAVITALAAVIARLVAPKSS